jgi:hypothetical protein
MTNDEYMLILGSNVYADPVYTLSYQANKNTGDKIHLVTLKNCSNGLILTTEIRDENSDLIAKINDNELIQVDEKFDVQGEIEKGNSLTLTRKNDCTVIFNVRITEDGYVTVNGIFYAAGKKIHINDGEVTIDDAPQQTINGVKMHDSIFIGTSDILITDSGIWIPSCVNQAGNNCEP